MPGPDFVQYGGQAILEGVMMRSPNYYSVACRAPNGNIVVHTEPVVKTWIGRQNWLKLPFLRGTFALLDGMLLGHKAMNFAGDVQMQAKYQKDGKPIEQKSMEMPLWAVLLGLLLCAVGFYLSFSFKPFMETLPRVGFGAGTVFFLASIPPIKKAVGALFDQFAVVIAMVAGLSIGFFIFDYLPELGAEALKAPLQANDIGTNYIGQFFKIIIFIGYLALIAKLPSVHELFKYHGAEHKAINALELEQRVDVETSGAQSRLHPRCGTSFMIIVLAVGFLLMPLVPRYPFGKADNLLIDSGQRFVIGLICLPLIAGISYELLKIAGKFRSQNWVNIAFAPGLFSQKVLTTVEPEGPHLEVAVASLHAVLHAEHTQELLDTDSYDIHNPVTLPVAGGAEEGKTEPLLNLQPESP